jgi:hypothetical protein
MKRYRKRPVVVEAVQWTGDNFEEVLRFTGGIGVADESGLYISLPDWTMYAEPGSYIVKGVRGEFYPVRPLVFHETYEPEEKDGENEKPKAS